MLTALASRAPISVADFEKAFAGSHPSINYSQQGQQQEQQPQEQCTPMQIVVKSLTGGSHTLNVISNDTVEDLRAKIQDRTGVPPCQQRIVYNFVRLEGTRSLSRYGIGNGAVIHMILKLRGD